MRLTTLSYLFRDGKVLMLHRTKKEQDINEGKWIGLGGKFLANESPEDCLQREVFEESGLTLKSFRYRGIISFIYNDHDTEYMHLFSSDDFSGELLKECDEGDLAWVPFEDVPALNLWPGDRIFLRLLFEDAPSFTLTLRYHNNELLEAILNGESLKLNEVDLC